MLTLLFTFSTALHAGMPSRMATCDGMLATLASVPATPVHVTLREALDLARSVHPPSRTRGLEPEAEHLDVYYELGMMKGHTWVEEHHHRVIERLERLESDLTSASAADHVIAREFRGADVGRAFTAFKARVEKVDAALETRADSAGLLSLAVQRLKRLVVSPLILTGGWDEHAATIAAALDRRDEAFSIMGGSIALDPETLDLIERRSGENRGPDELARMRAWIDEQASLDKIDPKTRVRLYYDSIFLTDPTSGEPVWLLVARKHAQDDYGKRRMRKDRFELPEITLPSFAPAPAPVLVPVRAR